MKLFKKKNKKEAVIGWSSPVSLIKRALSRSALQVLSGKKKTSSTFVTKIKNKKLWLVDVE